jgi:Ca2+-binding EF-hand superfamily protein
MKTNPSLVTLALVLGISTFSVAAPAGGAKGKPPGGHPLPPELLAQFDTNRDGRLSDSEKAAMKVAMDAKRAELIAKYDADGDGVLNATERAAADAAMQAARLEEMKAKFTTLDADTSGGLSLAEFAAGAPTKATPAQVQARFTEMDTTADGSLTLAEFTAKPTPPAGKGPEAKFAALDTDKSGGLSLAEFQAGAPKGSKPTQSQAVFTKADTSGDGSLSLAEFSVIAPKAKAGHGRP